MSTPGSLSLSGLGHRCRRETERYFRGKAYDPEYCFEIFHLALAKRDPDAWELIFDLYTPLVLSWVRKHSAFPNCGEEDQFFLNRAFERLWTGLTPEKFDSKAGLGAVLEYLKLCVHSAIIDHTRRQGPPSIDVDALLNPPDPQPGPENLAANRDFFETLKNKMKDDREVCFLSAYFSLGLKPREIAEEYPELFKNVGVVYRTRENIINRLSRDPDLQDL